jgi:putative endonuclease
MLKYTKTNMAYFVYIVKCKDKTLYTGFTTDLEKRIKTHNISKTGAKYTRSRRPVKLVYFEKFKTLGKALSREYKIKSLTKKEKLSLINGKKI